MKGDFSRYIFDPKKHYTTVLMQQGRVQVDADWNEQQAIHQNRIETEAFDVIGKCGAPKYSPGFRLTVEADNQLLIGQGRFYVDGILCHNEADVLYTEQPDLPNAPDIAESLSDSGVGIVYLDVWQRHLTALDDPRIREVALGGPDTTTRLKTVWQVRVLPINNPDSPSSITCDSRLPDWDGLIAPSTGTLSAQTVPPSGTDNPCLIPPTVGYQRLENQLYRVEIHQGSDPGPVTFKWSRDNGSVVTAIEQISGDEIIVADLGSDDVLGFSRGQWVEILDDALELNGLLGQLVQIDDIDPARRVITVVPSPTPLHNSPEGVNLELHPKLRRWDQPGPAVTAVTTEWIDLEGGIQVQFSNGTYKTGDYWLIPARTATGQIEWPVTDELNPTPLALLPLGIQHHYCRLAIAQFRSELLTVEDCRIIFRPLTELEPGEACCTVVVHPGEDIQVALDTLPPMGGCVCLKTGTHTITQPIRIERSNVVLEGESPGTRVVRNNGVSLLVIAHPRGLPISNVIVEQIQFEVTGARQQVGSLLDLTLVIISNGLNIAVQYCVMAVAASTDGVETTALPVTQAIGVAALNSTQVTLHHNQLNLVLIGIWGEGCTAFKVSENRLVAPTFNLRDTVIPFGSTGILLNLTPLQGGGSDCQIVQNHIQDFWLGVVVGVTVDGCKIIGNQIRRLSLGQLPNDSFNGQFFVGNEPYLHGIITYARDCTIVENDLDLNSPSYGGIRTFGPFTRIERNTLQAEISERILAVSTQLPVAIFLGQTPQTAALLEQLQLLPLVSDDSVVRNNVIAGTLSGIGVADTDHVEVSENQIIVRAPRRNESVAITLAGTRNTIIRDNQIRSAQVGIWLIGVPPTGGLSNQVLGNHLSDGSYGISATSETALQVCRNVIENMKVAGFLGNNLIEVITLTDNQIRNCGYEPPALQSPDVIVVGPTGAGIGAGILVLSVLGSLTVKSCEILNTGISREGQVNSEGTYWGIAVVLAIACQISQNLIHYSDIVNLPKLDPAKRKAHRALAMIGWYQPTSFEIPYPQLGSAIITDNVFGGLGYPYLVEFLKLPQIPQYGFEQVTFSHNQCFHLFTQSTQTTPSVPTVATVSVWGRHLIVMGNHVKADNPYFPSMNLNSPERVTLLGNITTGTIFNGGSGVTPTNPENFNAQV